MFDINRDRRAQILKGFTNLEKAHTEGVYSDTPANRKLNRVGASYSSNAPFKWKDSDFQSKKSNPNNEEIAKKTKEYINNERASGLTSSSVYQHKTDYVYNQVHTTKIENHDLYEMIQNNHHLPYEIEGGEITQNQKQVIDNLGGISKNTLIDSIATEKSFRSPDLQKIKVLEGLIEKYWSKGKSSTPTADDFSITGEVDGQPQAFSGDQLRDYLEGIYEPGQSQEEFINNVTYGITNESSKLSDQDQNTIAGWFDSKKEIDADFAANEKEGEKHVRGFDSITPDKSKPKPKSTFPDKDQIRAANKELQEQSRSSRDFHIGFYIDSQNDEKLTVEVAVNGKRGMVSEAEKKALNTPMPELPAGYTYKNQTPIDWRGKEVTYASIREADDNGDPQDRGYQDSEFMGSIYYEIEYKGSKKKTIKSKEDIVLDFHELFGVQEGDDVSESEVERVEKMIMTKYGYNAKDIIFDNEGIPANIDLGVSEQEYFKILEDNFS